MKRFLKRNVIVWVCVIIVFIVIFGFILDDYERRYENWIAITSFIVSMVALIVALITYFSIDSVSSITSMDGNVLENASYSVAYTELLRDFQKCDSRQDFQKKLMDGVTSHIVHDSGTCMQFSDSIQYVIDRIILFAYLDYNDPAFCAEYKKLKKKLTQRYETYSRLSNGIQYTLLENVKLITYVFEYQQNRQNDGNEHGSVLAGLEDVRENMIQNPISRIVFYDYLGLHYRRKASELMRPKNAPDGKEFSTEYMKLVWQEDLDENIRKQASWLLDTAEKSFQRANEIAGEDILWNGFLSYNIARVKIMVWLLNKPKEKEEADQITALLAQTVSMREKVLYYYGQPELCGQYLSGQLKEELRRAFELQKEFALLMQG